MNKELSEYPDFVQEFIKNSGKEHLPLHIIADSALTERQIKKIRVAKELSRTTPLISQALKGNRRATKALYRIVKFILRYDRQKEKRKSKVLIN